MLSLSLETEEHIFVINYPLAELGVGTAIETLWYSEGISFIEGVFMVDSKQPKALRHGNARVLT
jgi:hypothetical protein